MKFAQLQTLTKSDKSQHVALCWVLGEKFASGKQTADFGALLNDLKRDFAVMDSFN